MNIFRNILRLSLGDFFAKTLNFLAFLYLARTLGVTHYGVFEFAVSILTYGMLLSDCGLELWATRQAAQGEAMRALVAKIVPLRLLLSILAFGVLLALLPVFPSYPDFHSVLIVFGLLLLANGVNIKWVFMGQERLGRVAWGLVISQLVFSCLVFAAIRRADQLIWVPIFWLLGELAMTAYFWRLFVVTFGSVRGARGQDPALYRFGVSLRGAGALLKPALTIGAAQAMGLISYNFDALVLGFLLGPTPVGLYRAAYKPITAALAVPLTYFLGLFPALSRTYAQDRQAFDRIVQRSLRLTAVFGLPLGVGGTFFAAPIIGLLYGSPYAAAVPAMQLLSWSATLIILRDTFRLALIAAGRQDLDLRSAMTAVAFNVILNFLLIPPFGILGAASATVLSEIVWLLVSIRLYSRSVARLNPLSYLATPGAAALLMAAWCYFIGDRFWPGLFWPIQAAFSVLVYFVALYLLGEQEMRGVLGALKQRLAPQN